MQQSHQISKEMQDCLQHCEQCHAICTEMVQHCLRMGGAHAAPDHIRLLLDCAQICATSADYMRRMSPFHSLTCGVCAQLCQKCAEDCERLAGNDEVMKRCAEICRRCAASCGRMASKGAV